MKVVRRRIPDTLYRRIHKVLPILCADLVVVDKEKKRFLLVKRTNQPERGKWWLPGGRVFKNERLKEAALRKLKEEIGLRGKIVKQLGLHEYFSDTGYFRGMDSHTVVAVFLATVNPKIAPKADSQSSDVGWFTRVSPRWDPYVKKFLRIAEFR